MADGVTKKGEGVQLGPEDRARMAHLFKEIDERYHEMNAIVAKALGVDPQSLGRLHLNIKGEETDVSPSKSPRVISRGIRPYPGNPNGCYEDPPGLCFVCSIEGF